MVSVSPLASEGEDEVLAVARDDPRRRAASGGELDDVVVAVEDVADALADDVVARAGPEHIGVGAVAAAS